MSSHANARALPPPPKAGPGCHQGCANVGARAISHRDARRGRRSIVHCLGAHHRRAQVRADRVIAVPVLVRPPLTFALSSFIIFKEHAPARLMKASCFMGLTAPS